MEQHFYERAESARKDSQTEHILNEFDSTAHELLTSKVVALRREIKDADETSAEPGVWGWAAGRPGLIRPL
jgi:hypothetical protein